MRSTEKTLLWVGNALAEVRAFPEDARRKVGYQLRRVQQGLLPDDWRPISSVGPGVVEIGIHTGAEHRVLYLATFDDAIYVLRAYEKRSRRARSLDLEVSRTRLKEAIRSRRDIK